MKIKKGDTVVVIAGKNRGTTGKVETVLTKKNMIVIDGVNVVKKHRKATSQSRAGQIVEKSMPIHISNVAIADPKGGKPTRIRIERSKDGTRERVAVKSKAKIA
jgi:large subunit ribosomal protein L24